MVVSACMIVYHYLRSTVTLVITAKIVLFVCEYFCSCHGSIFLSDGGTIEND